MKHGVSFAGRMAHGPCRTVPLMRAAKATCRSWMAAVTLGCCGLAAAEDGASRPAVVSPRPPWTSSRITGRPEPPPPYRVERIYSRIEFDGTTLIDYQPTLDRFFVGERAGKIYTMPKDRDGDQPSLFFDCAESVVRLNQGREEADTVQFETLYGMAFDPDFATNRFCYVCYSMRSQKKGAPGLPDGNRVVRLRVGEGETPVCDPESEQTVITWLQGGHHGGCLRFGPDGCLYISTGDGSVAFPPDTLKSGQDLSTLLSKVLRIDVRGGTADRPYTIPPDNPFVGDASARGETWAYGLRQPWKMSFDRLTGELWAGDVGWELWELVQNVRRGQNYGWSIMEGPQPVNTGWKVGPTPIVPPAMAIPHTEGASITGGFVYRGRTLPDLAGSYVFGDWETRRIWAAKVTDGALGERREIVEPVVRIVDFAEDAEGELYLLDQDNGSIYTLVPNEHRAAARPFPQKLSETGLFSSVRELTAAPGVVPFEVNAEQWSDHAVTERLVAVPDAGTIRVRPRPVSVPGSMFSRAADFPRDSVLVKTLSLRMDSENAESLRRIETQILHFDGRDWLGYTYAWNDDQTDATLVGRDGSERIFTVRDAAAPDGRRTQTWRFSARAECIRCHNPWAEYSLAFNLPQLNRETIHSGTTVNQITALREMGLLESDTTPDPDDAQVGVDFLSDTASLPRLAPPFDPAGDLHERARAYLHVNCSHCHRFNGGGSARIYLTNDLKLRDTLAVGAAPAQGTFGIADAELIAPGDPCRSIVYFRLSKTGPGHMPHLGAREVDERGRVLIHDWIRQIPVRFADTVRLERLVELEEPVCLAKEREDRPVNEQRTARRIARKKKRDEPNEEDRIEARVQLDERSVEAVASRARTRQKLVEELLSSPASALLLVDAVRGGRLPTEIRGLVLDAARGPAVDAAIRDLFEVFLPEEQRTRRLGDSFDTVALLGLPGDAARGEKLFHESTVVQCRNCHRVGDRGADLGPRLDAIGRKYDRAKLLESIVYPSKEIDPRYATWLVETSAGTVHSGLLAERTEEAIMLLDPQNRRHRIPTAEIEQLIQQEKSLMPEMQLRDFTAEQAADLLAYLASLRADQSPADTRAGP